VAHPQNALGQSAFAVFDCARQAPNDLAARGVQFLGTFSNLILQRSPLILYSPIPDDVERLVREQYELIRHFAVATDSATRIYDQQDALFLPLAGLAGVERIGPTLDIYRLRETQ